MDSGGMTKFCAFPETETGDGVMHRSSAEPFDGKTPVSSLLWTFEEDALHRVPEDFFPIEYI